MKRTYLLFELNMLAHNRKNWLLGLALVLFFPIYFGHYSQQQIETVQDQKNEEAGLFETIFKAFPEELRESEEGQMIYDNLTEQASLINMQRFYLWDEEENSKAYIEDGLRLTELRLQLYDAGNKGMPEELIMTEEEIRQETALLTYQQQHDVPIIADPLAASAFIPAALDRISGAPFGLFVLLIGSSMMLHDRANRSVMEGLPVSSSQRMLTKLGVHLALITLFLAAGIGAGALYAGLKTGWGDFLSPLLLYDGGEFRAVSSVSYIVLQSLSFLLISLLLLAAFALLQEFTENTYAAVLIILFFILLPSILSTAGLQAGWLRPLVMLDSASVMNGIAAERYASRQLDIRHAFFWYAGLTAILLGTAAIVNRLRYRQPARAYRTARKH
ncbi:hypothetical protein [Sporosarcina koreensis]|uniref:hypothetical protein n=1 Tax=Sporosarcina koreensis TaxID=334735 RepID=UPI00058FB7C4|nr:hypothetical protein [Sporosarcina koreensis]